MIRISDLSSALVTLSSTAKTISEFIKANKIEL
jgi:hypothetical protein